MSPSPFLDVELAVTVESQKLTPNAAARQGRFQYGLIRNGPLEPGQVEWGAAGLDSGQTLVDPHHLGGAIVAFGGNDWLALTQEPTLEPELPICDPHHHFW